MSVLTRFAPSPTGSLHLGGARTALYNWLFARHHKGKFCLRIEDTDHHRSRPEHTDGIMNDLTWLGLAWDGPVVMQSHRVERHKEVALALLDGGYAYRCFCTPDELTHMREQAMAAGLPPLYDRRWRDHAGPFPDRPWAVRLKAPLKGHTVLHDMVQGTVMVEHSTLDDMVLLRADGTPTYMLAVVVDDHDAGVTHIIRGDDHLTNAFRQIQLYQAMGWTVPTMGHIPLIHSPGGSKLSKRDGAAGVDVYRAQGVLPQALANALLRLGWGHGNDERIDYAQAIAWFDGTGLSKSPARFDPQKVFALNAYYMRALSPEALWQEVQPFITRTYENDSVVKAILPALAARAQTLQEVAHMAQPYGAMMLSVPVLLPADQVSLLRDFSADLGRWSTHNLWTHDNLEAWMRAWAEGRGMSFGAVAKPLRLALTGSHVSPGLTEVMEALTWPWVHARLEGVQSTDVVV